MDNLVFSAALIFLASGLFTMCHTERVFEDYGVELEWESYEGFLEKLDAAAQAGDTAAQLQQITLRDWIPGDYEAAIPRLEKIAHDEPGAAHLLATAYMDGRGVDVDFATAARWLEQAAELGSEDAARDLAYFRSRH